MLGVKPYPYIEITPKTHQMRQAGAQAGIEWKPAPLAVSFSEPGQSLGMPVRRPNRFNIARTTCVRCGQCDAGCNSGSKNSMDLTYLSAAVEREAKIKTLHEVRQIRRLDDGRYEVSGVGRDMRRVVGVAPKLALALGYDLEEDDG